ncbi:bL17 family ribosomal protein [Roseiconus lacunae]|uniref:Large ribosomal subunit protein bL17 n=1 Tax=Roseiconus lacunae TaxID=2605694 RepID=A0ABT7PRM4_9BACT|nr:L17 family ribosomal protein [Roseiconus lacunae]MCD0462609.1 50S ribosomal protein L17 [Roseiconus lacunae]MDM4019154.1 L17 family ribosomal protein [Roseiconus lacunae]WRQ49008.1 L17 family ribosomal protein [Stieleria sp. HD01]
MRHRRHGRTLGRSPSHRKALLKNLASALFLTERDAELDENAPKVAGRITTTLHKAKEVRPLVEKCITIAKKSLPHAEAAREFECDADRGSDEYKKWRESDQWKKWADARAPVVAAQRRVVQLIGDREATSILFDTIAERFADRPGGYTRIVRLAMPRLGDAGTRAILELVGKNDRVSVKAERPAFDSDEPETESAPSEEQPVGAAEGSSEEAKSE